MKEYTKDELGLIFKDMEPDTNQGDSYHTHYITGLSTSDQHAEPVACKSVWQIHVKDFSRYFVQLAAYQLVAEFDNEPAALKWYAKTISGAYWEHAYTVVKREPTKSKWHLICQREFGVWEKIKEFDKFDKAEQEFNKFVASNNVYNTSLYELYDNIALCVLFAWGGAKK